MIRLLPGPPSTQSPQRFRPPHPAVARRISLGASSPVVSDGAAYDSAAAARWRVGSGEEGGMRPSRLDGGRRMFGAAGLNGQGSSWAGGRRTYWVVLEHAHGRRRSRARELVEEARHGHREEPHRDDTGFHCSSHTGGFSQCRSEQPVDGESFRGGGAPFLAMACCAGCRGRWEYKGVGADGGRGLDFGNWMG